VQEALAERRKWSYSTVKTMMDRMAAKGLLKTEKIRNLILYRSAVTRSQARKREVAATVKRAFNGALTPMMQFMIRDNEFTPAQLDELAELIRDKRKRTSRPERKPRNGTSERG
jgi:predicted transcriptional regulator